MASPWTSLLWFFGVIALIPLALWLLKRSPLAGGATRAGAPRAVAVLPLSAQQRLVTVEVGQGDERLWLVLGVSAQGIRTLHTMAAQGEGPPAPTPQPSAAFAQLLGRLRGEGSGRSTGGGHAT